MQQINSSRTNKERTKATRAVLMDAARKLFTRKGYTVTSTPEIVKEAGVTRGALYHHFEDKEALFRAVLIEEYKAVAAEIMASAKQEIGSSIESLQLGSRGYLNAMKDKGRVQVMLLDGPAVLGQKQIDEIDRETSAGILRMGLIEAMQTNHIKDLPVDALTVQLSALFDRAVLAISEGDDPEDHLKVLDAIFESLA